MTMPVAFLSHGAPPLADDARWRGELADWAGRLPRPRAILVVSAHWESDPITLGATEAGTPLVYDFWGFPQRYYDVTYRAPTAPWLADEVAGLLGATGESVRHAPRRGLDHGAYVPLVEMYPEADVPVLQMSLPTLEPRRLLDVGRALSPLRDQGVLVLGSGFTTHNLAWFDPRAGADATAPTESAEFDHWAAETVGAGDVDTVADFALRAPAAQVAHPRTEHWAPLLVAMGAGAEGGTPAGRTEVDGFWFGLSKRSWTFD